MLSVLLVILYILYIFTFYLVFLSLNEELFIDYEKLPGLYIDLLHVYTIPITWNGPPLHFTA